MKITLDHIAERSGVSKTTVSYILNNKQTSMGISENTREKVKGVIEELNYFPDEAAVALGRRNKKKIKILILTPWLNGVNSQFMIEVSRAAENIKKITEVDYKMYVSGEIEELITNKKFSSYDYFVVIGTNRKDDEFLAGYPDKGRVLLLNRKIEGFTYVSGDNFKGGELIAEHCLKSSHYEQYAIISNKKSSQVIEERQRGITEYFINNKYKKPQLIFLNDWNEENLLETISAFGKSKVLFFTLQDANAVIMSSVLQKNKFKIPSDYGITGYDNDPITSIVYPSITTVDAKYYDMAKLVFDKILNKKKEPSLIIPELVIRETTI
jgi:LacI family transcriptional regulator